jgi:3-hydroxypropanoate dehydrogenase
MSLSEQALNQLFTQAHTAYEFQDKPVSQQLLQQIYELTKFAPTSMNTQPARYVFVQSAAAKERLLGCLNPGNVDKTRTAPVTVIIANDTRFYEHLPVMFPQRPDADKLYADNAALASATAMRNGSLSGAYFILAARALGLDCGPMSGFDAAKLNAEFFPDGRWQVNFLLNLGYADTRKSHPRNPRLSFEQACSLI